MFRIFKEKNDLQKFEHIKGFSNLVIVSSITNDNLPVDCVGLLPEISNNQIMRF